MAKDNEGPAFGWNPDQGPDVIVETPNGIARRRGPEANTYGTTGNKSGRVAPRKEWPGGNRSGE